MANRLHPSEQKDGESVVKVKGKEYVRRVETKQGKDGVQEVHVSHTPYKKKSYGFLNQK